MTAPTTETNLVNFAMQSWPQALALLAALFLCSLIGLERELRQKAAGLRTHTLVGLGAALFMVVSKYGFGDVTGQESVAFGPSRVAAQIVSGIGFIGGGLIFVRRDMVRGLTTAAVVWVSAAVGTACGAGLWLVGAFVTAAHFLVVYGYPPLLRRLSRFVSRTSQLQLRYTDGGGALRAILATATGHGFTVLHVSTERETQPDQGPGEPTSIRLTLNVQGKGDINELAAALSESGGVRSVRMGTAEPEEEV